MKKISTNLGVKYENQWRIEKSVDEIIVVFQLEE